MGNALYMKAAIRSANRLRTALAALVTGPFTVVPNTLLRGALVTVYLSDAQADELTETVKQHRSPVRQEWMDRFFMHGASDGCGDTVLGHWTEDNEPCPEKWEHRIDGINLFLILHKAHEHQEVCGK